MLSTPTAPNRTAWRSSPGATPAVPDAGSGCRPNWARISASGSAPVASARPSRATPRRSASAVLRMSTRESGSSIQSTGTS